MFRRYNRWHDRFDQPDPYDGSYDETDPQSLNRYAYTNGDPVNFVDPLGLLRLECHLTQVIPIFDSRNSWMVWTCQLVDDSFGGFHNNDPRGGGGGGDGAASQEAPKKKCSEVVNLESADTTNGALARLIFAEATGYNAFASRLFEAGQTEQFDQNYFGERFAIAGTIYQRVSYLATITGRDPLRLGSPGASATDVIHSRGDVATTQYRGFTPQGISAGIQGRINKALASDEDSAECFDLKSAIYVANSPPNDPYGGRAFGFRTAGSGSPGSNFYALPAILGSGNTFYGLRR
jgi:hypothetical protein